MSVRSALAAAAGHSMRGYYVALVGGALLIVSAFLPWVHLGNVSIEARPMARLAVAGLGLMGVLLASLSVATRRNSRHPLLLVGLTALGIYLLGQLVLIHGAEDIAWVQARKREVFGLETRTPDKPRNGVGFYLGAAGSTLIVLFGLTIVVKRARLYAPPTDDDV
jgi:hypothetical protein